MSKTVDFVEAYEERVMNAVNKAIPATVTIVVSRNLPKIRQFGPFGFSVEKGKKECVQVGGGSGFIVAANGLVLTNRHVVSLADAKYEVLTVDGKRYPAEILAKDALSDIAILKIDPGKHTLPTCELGDSSKVRLGQSVIAIGTALGLFQNSVSKGIVSGLARRIRASEMGTAPTGMSEELTDIIQTDAAVNPGNSGGPLVDLDGKVIGINCAIVYGAQGIGFAIPTNRAKRDLEQLSKFGRLMQPFLGVNYLMINKDVRELNKFAARTQGALVVANHAVRESAVTKGSAAERAGLKEKDIIVAIDDDKITEKQPLADLIQKHKVGDEIRLKVTRDGKTVILKTVLGERK